MDEKWKNLQPPVAHGEITVNVNDWLKERQAGPQGLSYPAVMPQPLPAVQLPASASSEEQQAVLEEQRKIQADWIAQQELRVRAGQLTEEAKECGECGEMRQQYANDYVCYRCRDAMEE